MNKKAEVNTLLILGIIGVIALFFFMSQKDGNGGQTSTEPLTLTDYDSFMKTTTFLGIGLSFSGCTNTECSWEYGEPLSNDPIDLSFKFEVEAIEFPDCLSVTEQQYQQFKNIDSSNILSGQYIGKQNVCGRFVYEKVKSPSLVTSSFLFCGGQNKDIGFEIHRGDILNEYFEKFCSGN